jgi:hypothetical protein
MAGHPTTPKPRDDTNAQPPGTSWLKVLTGVAALIGAIASLATAVVKFQSLRGPSAVPTAVPSPRAVVATEQAPTPTLTLTTIPTTERVLSTWEDNFADAGSGWDSGADADAEWGYYNGEYRIVVHATSLVAWGNPVIDHDWADLVLIVEARRAEGPLDNQYGVIVRYVDRANFCLFSVSSDGMYSAQRLRNDEWEDLVTWTPSSAVRQEDATNVLRVECRGAHIRFFVNDQLLATVEDDIFYSGNVGLAAGSFSDGGVTVHFDNLLVRTLPES